MKNALRVGDESAGSAGDPNSSFYKSRPGSVLMSQPYSTVNAMEVAEEKLNTQASAFETPADLNIEVAVQSN